MQLVILCAGMGTRLGKRTEALPKTLLELNGKPVLDHILRSTEIDEVEELIIVGGFQFDKLKAHLSSYKGKPYRLVENPDYREGSVLTVEKALPYLKGSFALMNGDHIHPQEMLKKYLTQAKGIACACDYDRKLTDDDMKVKLDASGMVAEMDKKLVDYDCGYIGMTHYDASVLELYKEYLGVTLERYGTKSNVEKVVHTLAEDGHKASIVDLSGFGWLEIDNESDYRHAIEEIGRNEYLKKLA